MREWLVTNGLGSYASLTNLNENTSKFHGLLVASLQPPTKRWMFVSNIYDKIIIDDRIFNLRDFKCRYFFDIFPSFHYEIEGITIKKTIFMVYQQNTTIVKYEILSDRQISVTHTPILNSRHFYDMTEKYSVDFHIENHSDNVHIKPNNIETIVKIQLKDSTYKPTNYWVELNLEKDRLRNDSWLDYGIIIGDLNKSLKGSSEYFLILTLEDNFNDNPYDTYTKEIQRKKKIIEQSSLSSKFDKLVLSSDSFIVNKDDKKSIIAGYHWFADWGRDTLISLPGLTLVTNRFNEAKLILLTLGKYCKNGLIPNAYMDRDSEAVYNTVDASLWFIDRVYQYVKYTNDLDFLKQIWKILQSIVISYCKGTNYDIHMDDDFLISHAEGLSWMDVKIGDYYPTSRSKKAVEIQALWYNSLKIMAKIANILNKEDLYSDLSVKVKENFNRQFERQYDVIDTKDLSVRPNQIFLVSLDFSMINKPLQENIVGDVKNKLLTPFGLRTLSPDDSRYKGTYLGEYNRDIAYHNGTVWPWLLGPFIKSFVKINNHEFESREFAYQNFLKPMIDFFGDSWDGSINEIFDGNPPYNPRGCISQAWSVAEILRSWVEDIENISPKFEKIYLHEIGV
jgi:predicted glycogen debranching enzyme